MHTKLHICPSLGHGRHTCEQYSRHIETRPRRHVVNTHYDIYILYIKYAYRQISWCYQPSIQVWLGVVIIRNPAKWPPPADRSQRTVPLERSAGHNVERSDGTIPRNGRCSQWNAHRSARHTECAQRNGQCAHRNVPTVPTSETLPNTGGCGCCGMCLGRGLRNFRETLADCVVN